MLTPTDIHYLVGLLTQSSNPEDVEIELGSMVPDVTANEDRDIDITITKKEQNEKTSAYSGIEVKAHTRPLDITHVEQLCAKMHDMPSLSGKAIVSASGFTIPATRKADAHGVELYELKDWVDPAKGFEHFKSQPCPMNVRGLAWAEEPKIFLNPKNRIKAEDQDYFRANPAVFIGDDPCKDFPDLNSFMRNLKSLAISNLVNNERLAALKPGETGKVSVIINPSDFPNVLAPSGRIHIEMVGFEGSVTWIETKQDTEFKVLHRLGDVNPLAGCCVSEWPGVGLFGLMVSNSDRNIRLVTIPVSARNKQKIFREKLGNRALQN